MRELNDPALLAAVPGASLAALDVSRAPVLAAEVARLDRMVAQQTAAALDFFDAPAAFRTVLIRLA
jgi:hypothetical protein